MKKTGLIVGTLLVLALLWYLFLYPADYMVRMQAKTFPGPIAQTLKLWDSTLPNAEITKKDGKLNFTQELVFGDSVHQYEWEITPIHDSLSKIRVYAKDRDHSLKNKFMVPFSDTDFEKRTEATLMDFLSSLKEHIESFKVKVVGEAEFPGKYCACTQLKTTQFGKADGMMRDYPLLSSVLVKNGLQLDGPPIVEITQWDQENDRIAYNFCFPIMQQASLPYINEIEYLELAPRKALKAEYNGNYLTSDRAWYALLDYAEKNKMKVRALPIEVFYNNPTIGGDALQWKAEIYMPLEDAP